MTGSAIVALLPSAALAFLAAWFWRDRNEKTKAVEALARANVERDEKIEDLEARLARMDVTVTPFEEAYKQMLIKQLTHLHTPELDELLVKVGPPDLLTKEDVLRMAELLKERVETLNGRISESEKDAALILPVVIKRAKAEAAALADPNTPAAQLTVVAIAPVQAE